MYYLGIIISAIVGYFIGSISWSIIIVKWRKSVDVRTVGSNNAGATNTTRVLGKMWGFLVVVLDGLKVVAVVGVAIGLSSLGKQSYLFSETSYFIPIIFVLIGHCFPIYYHFKGGKAVACFLGLLFVTNIIYLLIFLLVWFIIAYVSKKVSVASIIATLATLIIIWFPWLNGVEQFSYQWNSHSVFVNGTWSTWFSWANRLQITVGSTFMSSQLEQNVIVVIGMLILGWRHWPNIIRIKKGIEPVTFTKK